MLASVETQGRRFSEIDGWTRLNPPEGHTSGNSVFSNRFAFLGSNLFSQSTTLATGLGNGVWPSAFNHRRRQLSGSSHFVPCPSSCHRPPTAISAAKVLASRRTRPPPFPDRFRKSPVSIRLENCRNSSFGILPCSLWVWPSSNDRTIR